jgi:hypothetical protein
MTSNGESYPEIRNRVPLTVNDLNSIGVPPRFWHPPSNPFDVYSGPLSWWDRRYVYSRQGVGYLALASSSSFIELASLMELIKRLLCDGDRPALSGSLTSSCYCVRATDCMRGSHEWQTLVTTGFLLVSGIGVNFSDRLEAFLFDLFRARYESGAVTFYHVVEKPGDKDFLSRVISIIPEGSYLVAE